MSELSSSKNKVNIEPQSKLRAFPALVQNGTGPVASRPKPLWKYARFWTLFGIPNLCAITYFGLIASPVYVSHASLEVSGSGKSSETLTSLLSAASEPSGGGAYVVQDFIATPDEFARVNQKFDLARLYGRYDFIRRFGSFGSWFSRSDVSLWDAYRKATEVAISKSGIAQIMVSAPSPEDAHAIALFILTDTIAHIRELNSRENEDYTRAAKLQVDTLEKALQDDDRNLQTFRSATGIYHPDTFYTAMMNHRTELLLKRLDTSAKIAGLLGATPNSAAASAFRSQLDIVETMISDADSRLRDMNGRSSEFAALETRHEIDARLLGEARTALLQSTIKASQDHYYIHQIGYPSKLQGAEYPHRILSILLVLGLSALLLAIARPTR